MSSKEANQHTYGDASFFFSYLSACKNKHWHLHVVNLVAQRVEVLSSISLTRGKRPSSNSIGLPSVITKAFYAFLLHQSSDIGAFIHVYHDVFGKKKSVKISFVPKFIV